MTGRYPVNSLSRAGLAVRPAAGPSSEARARAAEVASIMRHRGGPSPLASQLPPFDTDGVYFHQIQVPDGTATPAGQSAIFGLRRVRVPEDTGEEIGFLGADFHLLPTDSAAAGASLAGVALAWGDTLGMGAAIIVGRSLPMRVGAWSSGAVYLPGLDAAAPCLLSAPGGPKYLIERWFPAGKWNDTTPNKYQQFVPVAGYVDRITNGETLDVALVVRGTQIQNASGAVKSIVGLASINLYWAKLQTSDFLAPNSPEG
ncbi:MAG: hypothetical protein IT436_05175 [Phycisphaerales bacterium]|nr:hypothetical protein [Phycisphaerales bacterium]